MSVCAELKQMLDVLMFVCAELNQMFDVFMYVCAELKQMFDVYDSDKSGSINVLEVGAVMQNSGMDASPHTVTKVFQEMDIDCKCRHCHLVFPEI